MEIRVLAVERGCATIVPDTHEFQAPWLSELGYDLAGATHDTPAGVRQLLFRKRLP